MWFCVVLVESNVVLCCVGRIKCGFVLVVMESNVVLCFVGR